MSMFCINNRFTNANFCSEIIRFTLSFFFLLYSIYSITFCQSYGNVSTKCVHNYLLTYLISYLLTTTFKLYEINSNKKKIHLENMCRYNCKFLFYFALEGGYGVWGYSEIYGKSCDYIQHTQFWDFCYYTMIMQFSLCIISFLLALVINIKIYCMTTHMNSYNQPLVE